MIGVGVVGDEDVAWCGGVVDDQVEVDDAVAAQRRLQSGGVGAGFCVNMTVPKCRITSYYNLGEGVLRAAIYFKVQPCGFHAGEGREVVVMRVVAGCFKMVGMP